MIIESANKNTVVSGNFKTSGFRIEASSKAFQLLSSNIYTHKVRAIIRELSCNALDANVESGANTAPVVHLPTSLEPWFSVRDNGLGLSEEDVRNIFTVYFCSTKTSSNNYIGKYGLGSKVAYCLVDNFIVNSYYNGVKYSYSAYKDEDDLPQMALLTTSPSSEPSGLEVIVNVQGRDLEFQAEAVETYKYFDVVPTLNIKSVCDKIELARKFTIIDKEFCLNTGHGTCKAVMGNVAYDIPYGYGLDIEGYIKFEIGELDFDLGRESLSLDDKTKANLKTKIAKVKDGLADYIVSLIETEPTTFKKALLFNKLNSGTLGNVMTASKKKFPYFLPQSSVPFTVYRKGYKTVSIESNTHLPLDAEYYLWKPKFTTRIKSYLRDQSLVKKVVVLTDSQIKEVALDLDVVKDLDIIPKLVYNRSKPGKTIKVKKMYESGYWKESDLDTSKEYVYIDLMHGHPKNYSGFSSVNTIIATAASIGVKIELYGLSPAVKKRGLGVELKEFLANKITIPKTAILSKPAHKDILCQIDSRFRQEPVSGGLQSLYCLLGEVEHDDVLDKLSEKYVDSYPLIEYLNVNYYSKPPVSALKSYIKELK